MLIRNKHPKNKDCYCTTNNFLYTALIVCFMATNPAYLPKLAKFRGVSYNQGRVIQGTYSIVQDENDVFYVLSERGSQDICLMINNKGEVILPNKMTIDMFENGVKLQAGLAIYVIVEIWKNIPM